jgi:multidrug efflux pump subunit AcrA (membrane-fusion protein)
MSTQSEGGNGAIKADASVLIENGQPVAAVVTLPGGEHDGEAGEELAEAIEEVSSDAVEIARIEADAQVTIEAIRADAETAQAEIHAEVRTAEIEQEEEAIQWPQRVEALEASIQALTSRVETALLSPAPASIPEVLEAAAEIAEPPAETNLMPPFTSAETSETETEVTLESGDERPAAVLTVRKRRRLI